MKSLLKEYLGSLADLLEDPEAEDKGSSNYSLVFDLKKIQEAVNLSFPDFMEEEIVIRFRKNVRGEDVCLVYKQSALELVEGDGVVLLPDEILVLKKLANRGLKVEELMQSYLAKKILGKRLPH